MITKNLTLWLGKQEKQLFVPVSQYDDMWQFVFSIVNDSVPWSIPDSAQVTLNGLKPDGNVFAYYGTVSGGKATVDCDIQMTAVAGLVECELSILDSSKVVGTANFFLAVEQAPKADDAVISETTLSAYGEVLDQISQYAAGFIPERVKLALLACFEKVAWIDDDGQTLYENLQAALNYKEVVSISAAYTQGTVYSGDSLNSLKESLVVTATYDDTTTGVVEAYTLSGSLTAGTSTITVTYDEKTTTFTVTVFPYLDDIAFGTKTYRDMFITDNLLGWFGDLEDNFVVSSEYTYPDTTTPHKSGYKQSGTTGVLAPVISTSQYNSAGHGLDVSNTTETPCYMNGYYNPDSWGVTYIVAYACNVPSYTSGKVELQLYGAGTTVIRSIQTSATDGWQPVLITGTPVKGSSDYLNFNFGAMGNTTYGQPNLTAYIDDLVVTPLPSGMTEQQALAAFTAYLQMRRDRTLS